MAGQYEAFLDGGSSPAADKYEEFLGPEKSPPKSGAIRRGIGDTAVSMARGIVGVPEAMTGVADIVTGGLAGKAVQDIGVRYKDAKDAFSEYFSPEAKAAQAEVNKASGFFPTIGAMIQNPSTIVNSALESAPSILTGGAVSRGMLALAPKMSPIIAGAIGEGVTAAGQNAEQVRQEDKNGTLTGRQSAILAASGVLTAGISGVAGKVANKLGIGDVQTMLATGKLGAIGKEGAADAAKKGIARKIGEGFAVEGGMQELPQSYQEQVAQNIAQGKPWDEGAASAGAQGLMAGGLMGAVAGPLGERKPAAPPPAIDAITQTTPTPGDAIRAQKLPETGGPLTKTVNVGIEQAAQNADAATQAVPLSQREAGADTMAEIRQLDPVDQKEAISLLGGASNMSAPGNVRRYFQNRLDELLLPVRQPPVTRVQVDDVIDEAGNVIGPATSGLRVGYTPPGAAPLALPAPDGQPVYMADARGNAARQPAAARAEAMNRDFEARRADETASEFIRRRRLELGKQTPRGAGAPERVPTGEASQVDLIPTGEATDWEYIPTGRATEIVPEVILADDLLAKDGEPYAARSGAQSRAFVNGGGRVVAIPDHFGSGKPGYVVRPITDGRPNNTRGTNASDLPKARHDNRPDVSGTAGKLAANQPGGGAETAQTTSAIGGSETAAGQPAAATLQPIPQADAKPAATAERTQAPAPDAAAPTEPAAAAAGPAPLEAGGLKPRSFPSSGYVLTMPGALAKVKELEADVRARKAAVTKAPTKVMQRIEGEAASQSATRARKLRDDIKQTIQSYPDARAEYDAAIGAAPVQKASAATPNTPPLAPTGNADKPGPANPDTRYSQAQPTGPAITEPQARAAVAGTFGDKTARALLDAGLIEFVTGRDFNGATYADGRIQINLDAVTQDSIGGVLQHEAFHAAVRDWLGAGPYAALMNRLGNLRKLAAQPGALKTWFDTAAAEIPEDTRPEHLNEELAAYAIEQQADAKQPGMIGKWVQDFLSALRTAIIRHLPNGKIKAWALLNVKPQDLARMAVQAMQARGAAVRGEAQGAMAYSKSAQIDTPAFKRWFGDSKVVDADGKPLVVYHGTRGEFTVFDYSKIGSQGRAEGAGFYFTSSKGVASGYGAPMEVFLAIKQPLAYSAKGFSKPVVQKIVRRVAELEAQADGGDMADGFLSNFGDVRSEGLPAVLREAAKLIADDETAVDQLSGIVGSGVNPKHVNRATRDVTGHDGIVADGFSNAGGGDNRIYVAFFPEQIKSATGNNGAFDPGNADIRFSRTTSASAAADMVQALRGLADAKLPAGYIVNDFITSNGKLNWWHKTVGSMHNLAQRNPLFKPVYDAAQNFLNDVSSYAIEAADKAPTLLPKLEGLRDIGKSPLSPEDTKAISAPIFEGTLSWTRDENGRPVAESDPQKAGIVWTDAELRERFKLNDKQRGLYREMRAAVDKSLTGLAVSDMIRYGGKDVAEVAQQARDAGSVSAARDILTSHLADMAEQQPDRAGVLLQTGATIGDKAQHAQEMMRKGYAPLTRFGHYTLDVTENGRRVYFGLFESQAEANRFARKLKADYPKAAYNQGTMSDEAYKMFAGINPETLELFGQMLGLESQGNEAGSQAFQEFLKLTKSNRSAMKRMIERKGIAGFSEDAGRVLAGFVYSNARQASKNLHTGPMAESVREVADKKGQGELLDTAVKLHQYITNPQEEAPVLKGLLFAQFLGGSIAAGMVNLTQPVMVTFPYLSQYGGVAKAAGQMKKAMADAVKWAGGKGTGDAKLDAALKHAEEEGIVAPQEVHALMAQARGAGALKSGDGTALGNTMAKGSNFLSKLTLLWGRPFALAEQYNRQVTFIAAFRTAVDQKMDNPALFAEKAVNDTQFTYTKANRPQWARGAIGSVLFTFKTYSISYVELLARMANSGPEGRKAALLGLGVLFLVSGLQGLPGADDLDDLIDGLLQRLGYNFSSKMAKREFFAKMIGEGGAAFMMKGASGLPGAPIDVAGRLGLGNLIPGTGLFTKKADHTQDVAELFGPAGSLVTQGFKAADKLTQGEVGGAVSAILPVAAQNAVKAADMASTGMYRDQAGRKVIDTDGYDAMVKAIGFQPNDVARVQQATREVQGLIGLNKMRETEIADKWARGIFEKDTGAVQDARQELADWNSRNPDSPIKVNIGQLLKRLKAMREDKITRIERTAPKEIRATVRREIASAL